MDSHAADAASPTGCGPAYSENVSDTADVLLKCLPDRFFFSYADGELPLKGHDLPTLRSLLNRTLPSSQARGLCAPPLLPVTPSMLYGSKYTPRNDSDGGRWIVGDRARFYAALPQSDMWLRSELD